MEAQLHHPQDTGLHLGEGQGQVHDEGEQHHHKKSVLKKVKAKAKKIKDTLKHGLGHDHEHEHEHEHHPLQGEHEEEEEDGTDDEEMEEGAEVHGGPYAIRSKDIRKEDVGPMVNLENPTSPKEDRYDATMKKEEVHRPVLQRQDEFARPPSMEEAHFPEERHRPPFAETYQTKGTDHVTAHGKQEHQGLQGHKIGAQTGLEDRYTPHFREERYTPPFSETCEKHENVGAPTGLENPMHRPHAAADTHETMDIDYVTAHGKLEDQGLLGHKIGVPTGIEEDPHAPKGRPELSPNPTNYQSKVADPTGANNEEAGVSPLVRSFEKMGVHDAPETTLKQRTEQIRPELGAGETKFDRGTEHSLYTGSHDQFAPQEAPTDFPSVPKQTESLPKSMNPSKPEDSPQDTLTGKPGSYTEKISSATSAIADKAVAAKNVVASKLGYGGTEEESSKSHATGSDEDKAKTNSAAELAQKAVSTVAEKLAPVYEKVAGAGTTVMAKVQGTATGVTGHESRGGVDAEHEDKTKATDKGVSMKEYLAEKFKPGEEDKALSEVISGSLSRQKEKTEETGEEKLIGKVTESEEVERRLGPIEDAKKEEDGASGETQVGEGFGQGVVDRLKDVVTTWLGKGGETQTSTNGTNSAVDGGAVVGRGT
ncbi:low-temperature-induced 65 kDa protein-like [Nicotiana tomentosiformis]|uniref:low-temperature-induced 65 kDa protein-like n=1 Tax=Nicotiana tomentosiformis TaxID=4098 RepID=UPI00051BA6BC|nr:low-temperature-induced 65 kDa protein-like [Nicotiana tomentosiformis]